MVVHYSLFKKGVGVCAGEETQVSTPVAVEMLAGGPCREDSRERAPVSATGGNRANGKRGEMKSFH